MLDKNANQNWITNNVDVVDRLFYMHICFSLICCLLGIFWPDGAEVAVKLLYPITEPVINFHPRIAHLYRGNLSPDFYAGLTCEALVVSVVTAALMVVIFVARYYDRPWCFMEHGFNQLGKLMGFVAVIGSILVFFPSCLMVFILFGFDDMAKYFFLSTAPIFERMESVPQMLMGISFLAYSATILSVASLAAPISIISIVLRAIVIAIFVRRK